MTAPHPSPLPCPFCGSSALLKDDSEECAAPTFTVQCQGEDCYFSASEDSEEAILSVWNRRAPSAPQADAVAAALTQILESQKAILIPRHRKEAVEALAARRAARDAKDAR